ncbi:hypothetical protein ACFCZY_37265 [Streptomyces sp. NPDC056237]|uniref:hypothetical protein n=1 Tax=unclassified Streptomyces TaxID=2593676 RepID=UPI0035D644BA
MSTVPVAQRKSRMELLCTKSNEADVLLPEPQGVGLRQQLGGQIFSTLIEEILSLRPCSDRWVTLLVNVWLSPVSLVSTNTVTFQPSGTLIELMESLSTLRMLLTSAYSPSDRKALRPSKLLCSKTDGRFVMACARPTGLGPKDNVRLTDSPCDG